MEDDQVVDIDDDRDMPECHWPGMRVKYRPLPGWSRYRVGDDRSVSIELSREFSPPPPRCEHPRIGVANNAKLDRRQVIEIRRQYARGHSYATLSRRFGISEVNVRVIVAGRSWRDIPMPPNAQPLRWRRLKWFPGATGPFVKLRHEGKSYRRSVELLYRAAWTPGDLYPSELARLGRAGETIPPARSPVPADLPPPYVAPPALDMDQAVSRQAVSLPAPVPLPLNDGDDDHDWPRVVRGEAHGRSKLTEASVIEARRLKREGWTYPELVERYGVSKVTLFYAISGRTWGHVPMA